MSCSPLALTLSAMAKSGRNDGAAGMGARWRMGIVGLVRMRQHAVGKRCIHRRCQQARSHNRGLSARRRALRHRRWRRRPGGSRVPEIIAANGVENVLAGFCHHGRRQRLPKRTGDVVAEPARGFADVPQRLNHFRLQFVFGSRDEVYRLSGRFVFIAFRSRQVFPDRFGLSVITSCGGLHEAIIPRGRGALPPSSWPGVDRPPSARVSTRARSHWRGRRRAAGWPARRPRLSG